MSIDVPVPGLIPHHAIERTREYTIRALLNAETGQTAFSLVLHREVVVFTEANQIIAIHPYRVIELPHELFTNIVEAMSLLPATAVALDNIALQHPA